MTSMAHGPLQDDARPASAGSTPPRSGPSGPASNRSLNDLVRERYGVDLRELAGANVSGEIPLSDDLVNRLLAERLANHPQISAVRIQTQEGDTVAIQLVPRLRMMPPLRILARIERQPELPHHPMLLLHWTMPAAGPLALLAAPVLSYFKAMPRGIRMDGDRIGIDLRELLRERGFEDVLAFVRALAVHTRPGGFVARFELGI
jgi:hypothetical protein